MENFRVMSMDEAAKIGDIFVTATGCKDVIVKRHFDVMKKLLLRQLVDGQPHSGQLHPADLVVNLVRDSIDLFLQPLLVLDATLT